MFILFSVLTAALFVGGIKKQVKMPVIQSIAGALFGLSFSAWVLLELEDMQFTSTESGYAFIALLYSTLDISSCQACSWIFVLSNEVCVDLVLF